MKQNTQNVSPMSNEGRNAYVIEHLTDAMLELLKEKSINDISISELVEDKREPANLVARRAGLVLEVKANNGVTCALPGTPVAKGQILVFGFE